MTPRPPCPGAACGNWIEATEPCARREIANVYGHAQECICISCAGGFADQPDSPNSDLRTPEHES